MAYPPFWREATRRCPGLSSRHPGGEGTGIRSPLLELGLTKREVRVLAAEYGISVADRPSAPCLATRFPYGTRLSAERMRQVTRASGFCAPWGFIM